MPSKEGLISSLGLKSLGDALRPIPPRNPFAASIPGQHVTDTTSQANSGVSDNRSQLDAPSSQLIRGQDREVWTIGMGKDPTSDTTTKSPILCEMIYCMYGK